MKDVRYEPYGTLEQLSEVFEEDSQHQTHDGSIYSTLKDHLTSQETIDEVMRHIVQKATPLWKRPFEKDYRIEIYERFLKESPDLKTLGQRHSQEYQFSQMFRKWRPRLRKVTRILREEYGIS